MTSPLAQPETKASSRLPGLSTSFAVAALALMLARIQPLASPALSAVVAGMIATNTGILPRATGPGLAVAAKKVLRIGIVLLGLQLAVGDILALGPGVVGLIVAVVVGGIGVGLAVGWALRLPRTEIILISCGFSICGAAAVAAANGVLDNTSDDAERERLESQTAIALALVVVFGTLMIAVVPALTRAWGMGIFEAGVIAGGSIHEVAQVVAVGSIIGGGALSVAVLVKLGRVVMLAPVIALIGLFAARTGTGRDHPGARGVRPPIMPLWVAGFLGAIVIRSLGILPEQVIEASAPVQGLFLAAAMFALGAGAKFALIRRVGLRPIILAGAITVTVLGIALAGAVLL